MGKAIEIQRSYSRKKGKKSKPKLHNLIGCFRKDTIKKENSALRLTLNDQGSLNIFFRGEPLRFKRNQFLNKRKELPEKKDRKICPNAWRPLKRLSGKERRWITDLNHKISCAMVNLAVENNSAIALENLPGIKERVKAVKKVCRMLHNWTFRQLATFIVYKARLAGVPIVSVDPQKTSRICPKCGLVYPSGDAGLDTPLLRSTSTS